MIGINFLIHIIFYPMSNPSNPSNLPNLPSRPQRLPDPYRAEQTVVAAHLQSLGTALDWAAAASSAAPWVAAVRSNPPPFWAMESLLKEYPISSAEGLALMRLAEALLRVPDVDTAIALTADQLGRADFAGSDDHAAKTLARLSSSAIGLSKKFLPTTDGQSGALAKLGARAVVGATLRAVQLLGKQFVLGQTISDAMAEAVSAKKKSGSLRYSYDMLGEGARTAPDAAAYLASYTDAIKVIAASAHKYLATELNDGISIKLSALHPRFEHSQHARVMAELVLRVWLLCELAARANINLTIDAEEVDRLELSLDVFDALAALVALHYPDWRGFGLALQAYQTRALDLVQHVVVLARRHKLRLMCRLVKGAYWDAEIKRTQELGLPHYPVFTHKNHTDIAYLACAKAMLDAPDAIYPQFAGHNAGTIAAILNMAKAARASQPFGSAEFKNLSSQFELQRLHGMGEGVFREVLKTPGIQCRVYAPVGSHRDLLAYLVRRLLENGANSSFVHQLADESVALDVLLTSPLVAHPSPSLPLPANLFGPARANSCGLDLSVNSMRAPLRLAFATTTVPAVPFFDVKSTASLFNTGASSYKKWSSQPVAERAAVLRSAADAMQRELPMLCALLVKEAFKTWADAIAEVREAIDFLRYYAVEAERIMTPIELPSPGFGVTGETNVLQLKARGVWLCISPWNFPLAIFVGQVAAALATGNAVIAKPAEQTPGVAAVAVKLLIDAGVPPGVLQLAHGPGQTVGAALVAQAGIAGVVFTGSTDVAKIINRALAAKDGPITPLIAETGGINAMVVDSSALPEQVVDAVLYSAFGSAGQRCSALRLLCVHEGIADRVIEMIQSAVGELVTGASSDLQTDIGPVIDAEAFAAIEMHKNRLNSESKVLNAQSKRARAAPVNIANSLQPAAYEVPSIASVKAEIFGPVLQIVRWQGEPAAVIEQINALGYGLTLGIQTRIDSRAQAMAQAAHVGNVYVNRGMTGAVVGVQPFGGEALSGTGPKAGGPHYLYRFCAEQTVTMNTTAAGGNVALLGG